jgi:hypothetical protein
VVDSLRSPRDTLYPLKLALTSLTSGGRSVGIVRACRLKPRSFFIAKNANHHLSFLLMEGLASMLMATDQLSINFFVRYVSNMYLRKDK